MNASGQGWRAPLDVTVGVGMWGPVGLAECPPHLRSAVASLRTDETRCDAVGAAKWELYGTLPPPSVYEPCTIANVV